MICAGHCSEAAASSASSSWAASGARPCWERFRGWHGPRAAAAIRAALPAGAATRIRGAARQNRRARQLSLLRGAPRALGALAAGANRPRSIKASSAALVCRRAACSSSLRRGQSARGRNLIIVSIMSIGAGSVGVSARPALPITIVHLGEAAQDHVAGLQIVGRLSHGDPRHRDRHVHHRPFVERRQNARGSGWMTCGAIRAASTKTDDTDESRLRSRARRTPRPRAATSNSDARDPDVSQRSESEQERQTHDPDHDSRPVEQVR